MALTNRYALVQYNIPGPVVVHERWVLDHIEADDYIIVTPDQDTYCETMSPLNPDLAAFRVRPGPGLLPPGVNPAEVYGLPVWSVATTNALRTAATAEAQAERARRGLVAGGGAGAVVPVAGAAGAVAAPAAVANPVQNQGPRKPGATDIVGDTGVWVAAETDHGFVYGQKVDGVAAAVVVGAKHVHVLPGGGQLFVMCINEVGVLPFNNRPAGCDGRLSERRISLLGTPERALAEAASACTE